MVDELFQSLEICCFQLQNEDFSVFCSSFMIAEEISLGVGLLVGQNETFGNISFGFWESRMCTSPYYFLALHGENKQMADQYWK